MAPRLLRPRVRARLRPGACAVSGHTPGPWEAAHNDYDGLEQVLDADGAIVCLGVHDEEDARLIAAAPDLLRRAIEARDVLRKDGAVFLADHLEQAIERAERRP
jgi:hypothetical protein